MALNPDQIERLRELVAASRKVEPPPTNAASDEKAVAEVVQLTLDQQLAERQHKLATDYVPKIYDLMCAWLITVVILVVASGIQSPGFNNPDCHIGCLGFHLPESVLNVFIGSTTATVLGIFYIVAKWLYNPGQSDKGKKSD